MKTNSHLLRAADLLLAGLLVTLTGCATTGVQPTSANGPVRGVAVAGAHNYDNPPKPLRMVQPIYPFDLRRADLSGEVNLSAIIDENGRVQNARVEQTTHDAFNQPALDAFQQWTFQPAARDGAPIAVRVAIPMKFILSDR